MHQAHRNTSSRRAHARPRALGEGVVALALTAAAMGCGPSDAATEPGADQSNSAVEATHFEVNFRTVTGNYLVADKGGGAALAAYSTWAKGWETFTVSDINGGELESGDFIALKASDGHYVSADKGGGGAITVTAPWERDWELFQVLKLDGSGVIHDGDAVALKTKTMGKLVSAVNGGGGAVDATRDVARAWETFTILMSGGGGSDGGSGGGGESTPAGKVKQFLQSISGSKTVAGQHNREPISEPAKWTDAIHDTTGKFPGLWSSDFLFEQYSIDARATMIAEAKKQWAAGSLVQIMWHACPPNQGEACEWEGGVKSHLSDEEWSELITDGAPLNRVWKSRMDTIAVFLEDLKDSGVSPLFRPIHEMNQGVFWWGGRTGPEGTRKLYELTHDYLTQQKGLDNLVWVWDVQDLDYNFAAYRPRDGYFDVAALDVYGDGFKQEKYDAILSVAGGKPIAIGECDRLPTPQDLEAQPKWAFFMAWAELVYSSNSTDQIKSLYGAPNVLTREEMPGWK